MTILSDSQLINESIILLLDASYRFVLEATEKEKLCYEDIEKLDKNIVMNIGSFLYAALLGLKYFTEHINKNDIYKKKYEKLSEIYKKMCKKRNC